MTSGMMGLCMAKQILTNSQRRDNKLAMNTIPIFNLSLSFIPVLIVLLIMFRWSLSVTDGMVALARMLIQ